MEAPIPSFSTIEKVWALCAGQARAWWDVVANPKQFIEENDPGLDSSLPKSVYMLLFSLLLMVLVDVPSDLYFWRVKVFDVGTIIASLIVISINILVFASAVHYIGKALRGRAGFQASMVSMFFASAFLPFLHATHLVTRSNPNMRKMVLTGGDAQQLLAQIQALPEIELFKITLLTLVEFCVMLWVVRKTVPIIRFVHGVGATRAFTIFCLAGLISTLFDILVSTPVWAEIVKQAAPT